MTHEPTPSSGSVHAEHAGGVELIRSEEQVRVGAQVRASGRAVLRKYIITEQVTQTFEVRREEVRLDYEPISLEESIDLPAADALASGVAVEMVLHREVPVLQLQLEPYQVVRVHTEVVTAQVNLSTDVRKEQFDLDLPDTPTTEVPR